MLGLMLRIQMAPFCVERQWFGIIRSSAFLRNLKPSIVGLSLHRCSAKVQLLVRPCLMEQHHKMGVQLHTFLNSAGER